MSIKHCVIRILMGLLTALTLVASCDKIDNERQDEPADNEFVLAEEVILIEESDAGLIVSCGENDIVMSPSDKYDFSGGRILCCPVTEATPHGFAGRIVEVGRDGDLLTLRTEPVGLEDVFAELHVDGVYDMAETIEQSLDSEGSTIVPETVSDTVWNWLSESHADSLSLGILNTRSTKPATKAMVGVSVPVAISLPVECGGFKGSVYVKCSMGVSINISRRLKIRKFDITVNRQTGVEGRWTLLEQGLELKKELFSLEHRMRPVLIPGTPIAIVPSLYTRMGLEASAESKISASMRYQFENTTYTYSYGGGVPSFDGRNLLSDGDRYFRFAEFSTDGQVSASFVAGGKLSLWNEKVLAVGSEAGAGVSFEAEAAVSMDDDGLLVSNPEDFGKQKIVWIELTDESKFALSSDSIVPLNTVFFMIGEHIKYLLAVINSNLIHWYYLNSLGATSGVGTNRWLKYTVECIPVPILDEYEAVWNSIVDKTIENHTNGIDASSLESQIDEMVYSIYGLSEDEITYVQKNRK